MNKMNPQLDFSVNIKKMSNQTYLVRGQEAWLINEVAEEVCLLLNGKNSTEDITEKICTSFEKDNKTVQKDINTLLLFFEKEHLIEYS
ncbi:PqqD family protein [Metabacillus idriensis]|uniref:PqqD family protein n=1 Tax=Metabacillus idriensis TaxID=324768 RepID=UPI00174E7D8D|nr:PqqD family protein [Metabacillus idriensis]